VAEVDPKALKEMRATSPVSRIALHELRQAQR
jgi:hypothetical protein